MSDVNQAFEDLLDVVDVRQLVNHVVIVLDQSGSMDPIKGEIVGSFNQQIESIKESTGEMKTDVTLVTFDSEVNAPTLLCTDAYDVPELTLESYKPRGMTAMYDAVGTTIDKMKLLRDADSDKTSFLFVIISDGMENNSKVFDGLKLSETIKEIEKTDRWTFTYVGANQDLAKVSKSTGIDMGNSLRWASSSSGTQSMSSNVNESYVRYMRARTMGATSVNNLYDNVAGTDPDTVEPYFTGKSWYDSKTDDDDKNKR